MSSWSDCKVAHVAFREGVDVGTPEHSEAWNWFIIDSINMPVVIFGGCEFHPEFGSIFQEFFAPVRKVFRQISHIIWINQMLLIFVFSYLWGLWPTIKPRSKCVVPWSIPMLELEWANDLFAYFMVLGKLKIFHESFFFASSPRWPFMFGQSLECLLSFSTIHRLLFTL